jgi:hypothetical protein
MSSPWPSRRRAKTASTAEREIAVQPELRASKHIRAQISSDHRSARCRIGFLRGIPE